MEKRSIDGTFELFKPFKLPSYIITTKIEDSPVRHRALILDVSNSNLIAKLTTRKLALQGIIS